MINEFIASRGFGVITGASAILKPGRYVVRFIPRNNPTVTLSLSFLNANRQALLTVGNNSLINVTFRNSIRDYAKFKMYLKTGDILSLDEPAGPVDEQAQGLNDPEATIVFQPAAGDSAAATQAPVTIKIGALVPGKEDQRYAARSGFAYAVSVSKFSSERALSVTLKELLATAKTAEAAGTPKPGAAVGK